MLRLLALLASLASLASIAKGGGSLVTDARGGSLVTDAPMSGELRLEKGRGKESENVCGWAGVRERES